MQKNQPEWDIEKGKGIKGFRAGLDRQSTSQVAGSGPGDHAFPPLFAAHRKSVLPMDPPLHRVSPKTNAAARQK